MDCSEQESERQNPIGPQCLRDFIGQQTILEQLRIAIDAACARNEALDHVLLYGPPGLGKTTLANIIATEMGANLKSTSGPLLERKDDLSAILTDLSPGDVLFIDEIHRLSRIVEECLYPALEDYKIDIMIGEGPYPKRIKLELPQFTLVGATSNPQKVSSTLKSKFGMVFEFELFSQIEMQQFILRMAGLLGIEIESIAADAIAGRANGLPLNGKRLLKRVRDWAQVKGDGRITAGAVNSALGLFS